MRRKTKRYAGQFDTELLRLAFAALRDQPVAVQRALTRQIEDRTLRLTIEGKEEEAEALCTFVSSILPGSFGDACDTVSPNRPVAEAAPLQQAMSARSSG